MGDLMGECWVRELARNAKMKALGACRPPFIALSTSARIIELLRLHFRFWWEPTLTFRLLQLMQPFLDLR